MYTVFVLVIYVILSILLRLSNFKTGWIIWASFCVGYTLAFYLEDITKFLNNF